MTRISWWRTLIRSASAVAILAAVAGAPAPAVAIAPPKVDAGALDAAVALSVRPAPLEPTEQRELCAEPVLRGSAPSEPPIAQQVLDLPAAWQFSRGAGQKVAVIDTGVNRHYRLPDLQSGGDYVSDTDGTVDCDGHGTLVAGIIAARPSPDDAFVGVAPEAEILSIRQLSLAYEPKDRKGADKPPGELRSDGYGSVLTLAAAVVRAVDMGATVINISEVACTAAGSDTADSALGAAVKYAYERNVVVVAAAGNVEQGGACQTQNQGSGWGAVATVPTPAWFTPYVLSVASVDANGAPSALSLRGPWIGVAAIGRNIVSLDSKPGGGGLVDGVQTAQGVQPVDGTSFAAPYVAGLAALVRAEFPELNAQQVIDRIIRTAHGPGRGRDDAIGAGLIDPLAALTAPLPTDPVSTGADSGHPIAAPAAPAAPDPRPRQVAIIGSLTLLTVLGMGAALGFPFRARRADLNSDFE
ncbi:peptidase S8 [Nocardia sp. Root136]|uniref:type VII secretion-associated serine protease mycosin n=1 Tax=Nocardia sp. Root136 TaxID=1736458 RepID=UPI0006FFCD9D|nr:type VII secretion-associated serine protease mycosin [Nocardia sp. Root136]KQY33231.1 peptidase S8 [Nocardia sp. Root136]